MISSASESKAWKVVVVLKFEHAQSAFSFSILYSFFRINMFFESRKSGTHTKEGTYRNRPRERSFSTIWKTRSAERKILARTSRNLDSISMCCP